MTTFTLDATLEVEADVNREGCELTGAVRLRFPGGSIDLSGRLTSLEEIEVCEAVVETDHA